MAFLEGKKTAKDEKYRFSLLSIINLFLLGVMMQGSEVKAQDGSWCLERVFFFAEATLRR